MRLTILLTLGGIVLLCLMIAAATFFMPYRGMAGFFPPDVQAALRPRLDAIDRQPKAPRIFPETKDCAGWQQFGYNRKQQLSQCVIMLICCIAMAFVFAKL